MEGSTQSNLARILPHESVSVNRFVVGRQLLDVVTSGMYDSPLMIYREYIQNAVDSIDEVYSKGLYHDSARIDIRIDGRDRNIEIVDNGTGVSSSQAEEVLLSLGFSQKENTDRRGFRGIGRLGGAGYCDVLTFETRAYGESRVSIIRWDKRVLDLIIRNGGRTDLGSALRQVASIEYRNANDQDPPHFFKVILQGVKRFHSDELMQPKLVRHYLAQVAPVPYSPGFSYADEIRDFFSDIQGFNCYDIFINGQQLFRPYEDVVAFKEGKTDTIRQIEKFPIFDSNNELLGKGWYGITNFQASLPSRHPIKGIRVRQGNIEVGDEYFLADQFSERRFSGWHIGEIHLGINKLKTNARRDGFEQTPEFETFLEQTSKLCKHLSSVIRAASKKRTHDMRTENILQKVEKLALHGTVFIDKEHYQRTKKKARTLIQELEELVEGNCLSGHIQEKCKSVISSFQECSEVPVFLFDIIDKRKHSKNSMKNLKLIVDNVSSEFGDTDQFDSIITAILKPFIKPKIKDEISLKFVAGK